MKDNHQIRKLMDNIISKNFVDAKDNLHTILNQKVVEKVEDMKKDVVDRYYNFNESTLDPVGKEDDDVDNDGDSDSSDEYLKKRRNAISKAMKKDGVNEELYPDLKDTNQRILALLGKHSNVKHDLKWEKTTTGKYQVQIKPRSRGGFYGTYPGTPDGIYRNIQQDIESFKEGFNEAKDYTADTMIFNRPKGKGGPVGRAIRNVLGTEPQNRRIHKYTTHSSDEITPNLIDPNGYYFLNNLAREIEHAKSKSDAEKMHKSAASTLYPQDAKFGIRVVMGKDILNRLNTLKRKKYTLITNHDNGVKLGVLNKNKVTESEEIARIDLEMEKLKKKKERAQERDASKEGSSE